MNRIYPLLPLFVSTFFFFSCNSQPHQTETKENQSILVCKEFIRDISKEDVVKMKTYFDDIVLKATTDSTLDTALDLVIVYFKNSFPDEVTATFVTQEKTTKENIPSDFILLKLETAKVFGYYSFYLNSSTHKIILVQNSVQALPKRE
jgi:hypothetical protein